MSQEKLQEGETKEAHVLDKEARGGVSPIPAETLAWPRSGRGGKAQTKLSRRNQHRDQHVLPSILSSPAQHPTETATNHRMKSRAPQRSNTVTSSNREIASEAHRRTKQGLSANAALCLERVRHSSHWGQVLLGFPFPASPLRAPPTATYNLPARIVSQREIRSYVRSWSSGGTLQHTSTAWDIGWH